MAEQTIRSVNSFLQENNTKVDSGGVIRSYSYDHGSGSVLCMVHGFPQSSYMWRHLAPALRDHISLFIVELPGYGTSSPPQKHDKRNVGNLIIDALQQVFGKARPVVFCGHDRGARIGHRLAVDADPAHNIKAAVLLDIVPTLEQWRALASPAASKAYYHWPLLATPMAPMYIEAMGGALFAQTVLRTTKGGNEAGAALFEKGDAMAHYGRQFSNPECIAGACADYAIASTEDVEEQEKDQQQGRKVSIPLMVVYSAGYIGKMHDVPAVWQRWVDGELRCEGIGDGYGHYLPEECPDKIRDLLLEWIGKHTS